MEAPSLGGKEVETSLLKECSCHELHGTQHATLPHAQPSLQGDTAQATLEGMSSVRASQLVDF